MQTSNVHFATSQWQTYSTAVSGFAQNSPKLAASAMKQLASLSWVRPGTQFSFSFTVNIHHAPRCGCLPAPRLQYAGAPAGKGLTKNPEGFPKGSVRTAGGYTVVPENGNNAWSIYSPGKEMKDGAVTRIWGDPHVDEKDGTRWDFTKNSRFRLPDGTLINANTTSQQGASVTKSLDIVNGSDRVHVSGIDRNQPQTSEVKHDGYQWRNEHLSTTPNRDTFVLGGNEKNVHWFKANQGRIRGLITGSRVNQKGNYEQILDKSKNYFVDPNLRPPFGSQAWGNGLRSGIVDGIGRSHAPESVRNLLTSYVNLDHQFAASQNTNPFWTQGAFGGWGRSFPNVGSAFSALSGLGNELFAFFNLTQRLFPSVSI